MIGLLLLGLGTGVSAAQTTGSTQPPAGHQPPSGQPPPAGQKPPAEQEEPPVYVEAVVVTASKVEQQLGNAPAKMTVVTSDTIQSSPSNNFAELLKSVPGMNITQTSARDYNLNMRGATSTLSTSQLAVLDRPQPLPGLLRLHRVGSRAGQRVRAEAGGGDPRAGIGHLGRQRDERGDQLHLEDAA